MMQSNENLEDYGERISRLSDQGLVREIRSYRHRPRPPLLDMAVMEVCLKVLTLPKEQRHQRGVVKVHEPSKLSYERE